MRAFYYTAVFEDFGLFVDTSRRDETGDIERFKFSSHRSHRKIVRQTHGIDYEQRADFDEC